MVKTQMKIVSSIQDKFTFHPKQQSAFKLNIFISMLSWIQTLTLLVSCSISCTTEIFQYVEYFNTKLCFSLQMSRFYADIFKAIL